MTILVRFRTFYGKLGGWFNLLLLASTIIVAGMIAVLNIVGLPLKYGVSAISVLNASILVYLILEKASVLDDIRTQLSVDRVRVFATRDALYSAVTSTITELGSFPGEDRRIFHAAFHSQSDRLPDPPSAALRAFDELYKECVMSSGVGSWKVQVLFNISTERRLDAIVQRISDWEDAEDFEVRCFVLPGSLPNLSPMVIGKRCTFLAIDDPRYYRVRKGLSITGEYVTQQFLAYLEEIWRDDRTIKIRSETGLQENEVERARNMIRNFAPPRR
jgi:hypothetical protein